MNTTRRLLMARTTAGAMATPALAACGAFGQSSGGPATTAVEASGKVLWEIRAEPQADQLAKDALPLFRERFPRVEVEYFPKAGDWVDKDLSTMAAGSGPDVLQAWDHFLWLYASRGATLNVNDLLRDYRKADVDDFIKGHWDSMEIPNSKLRFAMPGTTNIGIVFFNRGVFRRAGVPEPTPNWTYDEYADKAKRLTRMEGDRQVFGVYHPTSEGAGGVRTQNHIWAFGGNWVDPKDITKLAAHQPPAQQGLEWLHDRYWRDNSWIQVKQRPAPWQWWNTLGNGGIAMAEDGVAPRLIDFANMQGLEFDIALPPKGPVARMNWLSNPSWILWKDTRVRAAAWEFAKFLSGPDFLKLQSRALLFMPPRVSLLDDWMQAMRQRYPSLEKVNLKLVRDAATASPSALRAFQFFPCQGDVQPIVQPLLVEMFGEGSARPSILRDYKDQIERAGSTCGATFK